MSLTLNSLSRWAVPVFIMISGALLLPRFIEADKPPAIASFFRRRLLKIGILIIIWTSLYLLWQWYFFHKATNMGEVLLSFLLGNTYTHLFFLFIIGGLYMATPFVGKLCWRLSTRGLLQLSAGLLVVTAVGQMVLVLVERIDPAQLTIFGVWVPYLGYYMAGYSLRRWLDERDGRLPGWVVLMALTATVSMIAAVYWATAYWHGSLYFHIYTNPMAIIQAMGAFVTGRWLYEKLRLMPKADWLVQGLIQRIAPLTLGIYLIHLAVLDVMRRVILGPPPTNASPKLVLVLLVATFGLSAGIVWALQRIPLLRTYAVPN